VRNDQASDVPDFVKHYLSLSSVMGPELSAVHTPALFALPCLFHRELGIALKGLPDRALPLQNDGVGSVVC